MLGHPVRHFRQPIIHKLPTTRLNYALELCDCDTPSQASLEGSDANFLSEFSVITSINKLTQQVKVISNSIQALYENYFLWQTLKQKE